MDSKQEYERLAGLALEARKHSHAPYSNFCVGAALLTREGKIYTGCNIENAAYTPSNCAERTAFFKAVSEGEQAFRAIAIAGGKREEKLPLPLCAPCGVCRQVMMEFCDPEQFQVILVRDRGDYQIFTLLQLLPEGFGPGNLKERGDGHEDV